MNIGDPCPQLYGWTILALKDPCPKHGCERFDVQYPRLRYPYRNVCHLCFRERHKNRQRAYRKKVELGIRYHYNDFVEGIDGGIADWWKEEYDRNIEKFWAQRIWKGRPMTDEIAKKKFGPAIKWPREKAV